MKQFYDFKIEKIKNLSSKDKNLRKKNLEVFNKNGFPNKKAFIKEHKYLKDAIQMANNYSKNQGRLPNEFEPGWTIFTKNRGYMRKIGEFKENNNGK